MSSEQTIFTASEQISDYWPYWTEKSFFIFFLILTFRLERVHQTDEEVAQKNFSDVEFSLFFSW